MRYVRLPDSLYGHLARAHCACHNPPVRKPPLCQTPAAIAGRAQWTDRRQRGLCTRCGHPSVNGFTKCAPCSERDLNNQRRSRDKLKNENGPAYWQAERRKGFRPLVTSCFASKIFSLQSLSYRLRNDVIADAWIKKHEKWLPLFSYQNISTGLALINPRARNRYGATPHLCRHLFRVAATQPRSGQKFVDEHPDLITRIKP